MIEKYIKICAKLLFPLKEPVNRPGISLNILLKYVCHVGQPRNNRQLSHYILFLAHLSRRLVGELIVYPWSVVRPLSTISNMNISATRGPITMKFYQKHHWDGGKAALSFCQIGLKLRFPWQQIALIGL